MTTQAILLIAAVPDALLDRLASAWTVHRLFEQDDPQTFLADKGDTIKAVVTRGDVGVRKEVLEQLPNAGLVAVFGVGTDATDLNYTRSKNIAVTITSGVLTNDVADMAMGLLLAASRRLCQGDSFVRQGKWLNTAPTLGNQVSGKRIGILGMGNIGQAIARRAAGFDMQISYTSRSRHDALPYAWHDDVQSLARDSDFLVIAAAGGESTKGLVNADVLHALPKHAWLINIARGTLVDQSALIQALRKGDIAGAALDVYEQEPQVPEELIAMSNVVLQPHVGSATHETRQKMSDVVFANVEAFFKADDLPNAI
ncbi:2-hydroxyacid dehydrogenase [Pantoea sp. CCBC3-3-1]|uniref:2-hydroxyacid dehydrogenase n=1 Tax=Pantoea sp. CCBC3-3-1 TaxID=2490851 RepID=UPI0011BE77FB|nr:2-hydroxyacid dehydrogenase [Pantoea sp. CCBC3-3-1]